MKPTRSLGKVFRRVIVGIKPNQRLGFTNEGRGYLFVWLALLAMGLYQQSNLILLVAGLAAGPLAASVLLSAGMLRRLQVTRRSPSYVFEGEPLPIDYVMENQRKHTAVLALTVEDSLTAVERSTPGFGRLTPGLMFARVPKQGKERLRWVGSSPARGRYQFESLQVVTRAPFGLLERRLELSEPATLIVYPRVGQLVRRWHRIYRESTETKRGRKHHRTVQQQEYHGLRDYRPGDSPRWIHWRTTARLGQPMVKEFEHQQDQDVAVLIDPWMPRTKVTGDQREYVEQAIRFTATLCLETCRQQGRRLTLGWTGPTPGIRQGPASVKLLHELLESLAVLRPFAEGQLSALFDALPAQTLREAFLVIVSTRALNLQEEAERSARLSGASGRGLVGKVLLLDVAQGDLKDLIQFGGSPTALSPRKSPESLTGVMTRNAERTTHSVSDDRRVPEVPT